MSKLITMVQGGYKVGDTKEIIPANNLIPFGIIQEIPGGTIFNRRRFEDDWPDNTEEMNIKAEEYASSMNAPFYEMKINNEHTSVNGFFTKTITSVYRGMIQLYVENKK
jgi:hypothetical protein